MLLQYFWEGWMTDIMHQICSEYDKYITRYHIYSKFWDRQVWANSASPESFIFSFFFLSNFQTLKRFCCLFSQELWGLGGWINTYHAVVRFNRRQIDDIFLIFFWKIGSDTSCKLSPRRQFAWSVRSYFLRRQFAWSVIYYLLEKIRKIFQNVVCWNFYPAYKAY